MRQLRVVVKKYPKEFRIPPNLQNYEKVEVEAPVGKIAYTIVSVN